MTEARRIYRVGSASVDELNFVLSQLADRLDQMEGFRDTPHFRAAPNMGGNKATNLAEGEASSDAAVKGQLESSYPVGALFFAVVATNPATLLGFGTWVAFGTGKFLVGIDPSDTDFDTVRETGGAKTHTHSTPAHVHPAGTSVESPVITPKTVNDGSGGGGTTGSASGLPPYLAVYMWERIL